MNMWIEESELDEIKAKLSEWSHGLSKTYKPGQKIAGEITEQEFLTVVKRVANLEAQNRKNAELKLSDFKMGDIIWYLIENKEIQSVLNVDSSHEYDIKTNFSHIHGSGKDQVIIVL